MSEIIAKQLSNVFTELTSDCSFSDVAQVSLRDAKARGRAVELLIWQSDTDDLSTPAVVRSWWLVDASGIHEGGSWPWTDEMVNTPGWFASHPMIKFATDGKRVFFGMRLGYDWYMSRIAKIGANGEFISEGMEEKYTHFPTSQN